MAVITAVVARWACTRAPHLGTDWSVFEVGARSLVHYHHLSDFVDSRWKVYVDNADIQIGPPALWFIAAFERLSFTTIYTIFSVVMPIIGAIGIAAATATGRLVSPRGWSDSTRRALMVLVGLLVTAIWAYYVDRWRHLDDLLALSFAACAAYLIARRQYWWLAGLLLGTGISAKPWALILAPMILVLPRKEIARTTLATIVTAAGWWGPFVIAAPDTISALGQYQVVPDPGSVLYLVGIHSHVEHWLRPVQFILGLAVGTYVCRRRPWAAGLAALASRVLTDPYAYGYYGLGPLLFAYLYDCSGGGWRGLPVWTLFTAAMEFGVPHVISSNTVVAVSKLLWALTVLVVLVSARRDTTPHGATESSADGAVADGPSDALPAPA